MKIRFGFVAMSMLLSDVSPSKTITIKGLSKIDTIEGKLYRLKKIAKQNLTNTLRLLKHANSYDIKVYRITSKLVPLATHDDTPKWDFKNLLKEELISVGDFVKANNIRLSAHPDHFTVLNSTKEQVIKSAIRELEYHHEIFNTMGLEDEAKLVLHVGGVYNNKQMAINNFVKNYNSIPPCLKKRIILENDDKSFNVTDVLSLCYKLNIPMVLDVHHHQCNPNGECLKKLLPDIFDTWKNEYWPPKIHFSSPKSENEYRYHADFIDVKEFYSFLNLSKSINKDFDVMIEAKRKDEALLDLVSKLKDFDNIKIINNGCIEY